MIRNCHLRPDFGEFQGFYQILSPNLTPDIPKIAPKNIDRGEKMKSVVQILYMMIPTND